MLREFKKSDWETFAGAENLRSGPPLIAYVTLAGPDGKSGGGVEATVVVARAFGAVAVQAFSEGGECQFWTFLDHQEPDAKAFAEFIAQGCMSWSGLRRLT